MRRGRVRYAIHLTRRQETVTRRRKRSAAYASGVSSVGRHEVFGSAMDGKVTLSLRMYDYIPAAAGRPISYRGKQ